MRAGLRPVAEWDEATVRQGRDGLTAELCESPSGFAGFIAAIE